MVNVSTSVNFDFQVRRFTELYACPIHYRLSRPFDSMVQHSALSLDDNEWILSVSNQFDMEGVNPHECR